MVGEQVNEVSKAEHSQPEAFSLNLIYCQLAPNPDDRFRCCEEEYRRN